MIHKRNFSLLLICLTMLTLGACGKNRHWIKGSGDNITQSRSISNYNGIALNIDANIEYNVSAGYKLEITAQQNIADVIETVLEGSRLSIRYKNNVNVRSHNPITIRISSPLLNTIAVNGSGSISCNNSIGTSDMSCAISGSGNINMSSLQADNLDITISGSGDVNIFSGQVSSESVKISGSGDVSMTELQAKNSQVSISGSGDVRLQTSDSLNVSISGSGDVYYKGNPVVNTNISGSGSVIKI